MSIAAPVAGAYTGTWNSNPLNYTRQGFNLNLTHKAERVEESDLYGLSLIEMIFRGTQLMIDTILKVFPVHRRQLRLRRPRRGLRQRRRLPCLARPRRRRSC